ncbi:MAG TPA: hypothetical protein VFD91_17005 [Mariniphaga sp.]|nr:hypothetical protein [Mariniphaga sp.]
MKTVQISTHHGVSRQCSTDLVVYGFIATLQPKKTVQHADIVRYLHIESFLFEE